MAPGGHSSLVQPAITIAIVLKNGKHCFVPLNPLYHIKNLAEPIPQPNIELDQYLTLII
jgi:hypothetical protein